MLNGSFSSYFGFSATAIWDKWSQHQFQGFFLSNLLHNFVNDYYGNYSIFSNLFVMVPHFLHLLRTEHCLLCKTEIIGFISMPTSEGMISQKKPRTTQSWSRSRYQSLLRKQSNVMYCTMSTVRPQWPPISQYLLCTSHQHWITEFISTMDSLRPHWRSYCSTMLKVPPHWRTYYSSVRTVRSLTVQCTQYAHTDILITVQCAHCAHLQYSANSAPTLIYFHSTVRKVSPHWHTYYGTVQTVRSLTVQCTQCANTDILLQYSVHSALTYSTVRAKRQHWPTYYSTVSTVRPHWRTSTVQCAQCAQSAHTDPLITLQCAQCVHLQYSGHKAPTLTYLLQ